MSKKSAILIVFLSILIAIVGLIAWTLFLSPQSESGQNGEGGGIRDIIFGFFPDQEPVIDGENQPIPTETGTSTNPDTGLPPATDSGVPLPAPVIRQITTAPTAGFIFTEDKKEGLSVRYLEKETGHVYAAPLAVVTKTRLTNTTIPRVREAVFLPGGNRVVAQYLGDNGETIRSFVGEIKPVVSSLGAQSEGVLDGEFLGDNFTGLTGHPAVEKIFYLLLGSGAEGITAERDGSKSTRIFSSVLREWVPQWVTPNTVHLTTKASGYSNGMLVALSVSSGAESILLQDIVGLTTNVSPKNDLLLYGRGIPNSLELYAHTISSGDETKLPLNTLPEKCAWDPTNGDIVYCGVPRRIPQGIYPDSWYKGLVAFDDGLWRINIKTSEVSIVGNFKTITENPFDIIKPSVSKNGEYVVFVNQTDDSLWSVKVK